MAQPYVGEIRMTGFNFAPTGWLLCQGQSLSISEYSTLFAVLGTTYGGDGQNTFNVPDLRGRMPVHQGPTRAIGSAAGTETVTLTGAQMPGHNHPAVGTTATGTQTAPAGATWAADVEVRQFASSANATMAGGALAPAGGDQAHENMPPFVAVNFIIAAFGSFPLPA